MAKLDQPLNIIRKKKKDILKVARAHGIVNVRIFGSLVRDEATPNSDIDLLVDLEKGRSLLDLVVPPSNFKSFWGEKWLS